MPLKQAIKTVTETKLLGTWRLAIYGAQKLYVATNSGELHLGRQAGRVVVSSDGSVAGSLPDFAFAKVKQNCLLEISTSDCSIEETGLTKQIKMPALLKEHIYL